MFARDAAEASRKLTLPKAPDEYKFALPADFKAPQGIEFIPNDKDPLLPQARAFALKHGLSQEGFGELLALHAAGQVGNMQAINDAKAAEVTKLGVNGPARKTAADTWLKAMLGDDLGKHMGDFMFTSRQVEAVEKLMERFRTQGAASPGRNPEAPPDAQRVSEEQYKRMSAAERLNYVRQFDQRQFNNGAGTRG